MNIHRSARITLFSVFLLGLLATSLYCQDSLASSPVVQWRPAHVVVVIEENRSFSTIIGSADAPYLNQLAREGVLFTNAHAVTHPSQPNYVALFSGSTHGLTDDSCPHGIEGPNLASVLLAKKLSFAIYSENMPEAGFTGCSADHGLYRRKHNPVADFQKELPTDVNLPYGDFPHDYSKLPTVAFVVPNMMDDMHDGTIDEGDTWLKAHLSRYAEWAKTHDSLLIVAWDESDARSDTDQIPLIVVGAGFQPDHDAQYLNHYGLLRTIEDFYDLFSLADSVGALPATTLMRGPGT